MAVALYSTVQYIRDPARREPLNIGVIVAESRGIDIRLLEREEVPSDVVQRFRETLDYIRETEFDRSDAPETVLRELAARRFSGFAVLEPLQVVVDEGSQRVDVDALLERLVTPARATHPLSF